MENLDVGVRLKEGRYEVEKVIGCSDTALTISAFDLHKHKDGEREKNMENRVAIKLTPGTYDYLVDMLLEEHEVYEKLKSTAAEAKMPVGIPECLDFFTDKSTGEEIYGLVLPLFGDSLACIQEEKCGGQPLSLRDVVKVAVQMIERLESLHRLGYIHRDIKPGNIVIGGEISTANTCYLIDYGLAIPFREDNGRHIAEDDKYVSYGTYTFVSARSHKERQQNRADDLEALGYTLLYLLHCSLPWSSMEKGERAKVAEMMDEMYGEKLCDWAGLEGVCRAVFIDYFQSLRTVPFTSAPNYAHLRELFKSLGHNLSLKFNTEGEIDEAFEFLNGVK